MGPEVDLHCTVTTSMLYIDVTIKSEQEPVQFNQLYLKGIFVFLLFNGTKIHSFLSNQSKTLMVQ